MELLGLAHLKEAKNLLAFSHGVDSTALFYLLLEKNIAFDLALINYQSRPSSKAEELAAIKLAKAHKKEIFIKHCEPIAGNFESKARIYRYDFFKEIINKYEYENLILAQHLNDNFEWFMMQLAKGAGLFELLGMREFEKRSSFNLIRPLIQTSKDEIEAYLNKNKIKYFEDESNKDKRFTRNKIRALFASAFVSEHKEGIKRSFSYLQADVLRLHPGSLLEYKGMIISPFDESFVAKAAKYLGVVLSASRRKEAMRQDMVASNLLGIVHFKNKVIVFKYERVFKMSKTAKQSYRLARIPSKLRGYLYKHDIVLADFLALF